MSPAQMRHLLARTALLLQAEQRKSATGKLTLEDLLAEELLRIRGTASQRTPAQRARALVNELMAALETIRSTPTPTNPSVDEVD